MSNRIRVFLVLCIFLFSPFKAFAENSDWEYKVVIVQGITAGGTINKLSHGVYVDTKRTKALNELANKGWSVVSVVGELGTDHMVYLKRNLK